jgi:Peptidase_C39 like family
MIILLLTVLVISITIIIIGLLLSPRFHESEPTRISYAGRAGRVGRVNRNVSARRASAALYGDGRRRPSFEYGYHSGISLADLMNVRNLFAPRPGEPTPWLGIALILLTLCITGVFLFRTFFASSALLVQQSWPDLAASKKPPVTASSSQPDFPGLIGASQSLVRLNQLDPAQYGSQQEYNLWAYSTCSAASMTEVINSYDSYYHMGRQYRITDILKVEASLNAITPQLGLLEPTGIDRTVARFNFQVTWLNNPSLDELIKVANSGRPIIVNFPPDRWSGGHLLVVRGGNSNYVYLADSSRLNMQSMARQTFLKYWAGFAAIMTPVGKK